MKTTPMTSPLRARRPLGAIAIFSLALMSAASLQAAILTQYDMENTANRRAPTTVAAGVSANDLQLNNLSATGTTTPTSNPDVFITMPSAFAATGTTAANALTAGTGATGTYFSFTITPAALQSMSLTSLTFDAFAATSTTTANRQIYVFSDKAAFTSGNELFSRSTQSSVNATTPLIPFNTTTSGQNYSIDLSGVAFQNLTTAIQFRFYTQTDTASQALAFDDITVNGSVIPEPSTFALLGLAGLALAASRRRRRA